MEPRRITKWDVIKVRGPAVLESDNFLITVETISFPLDSTHFINGHDFNEFDDFKIKVRSRVNQEGDNVYPTYYQRTDTGHRVSFSKITNRTLGKTGLANYLVHIKSVYALGFLWLKMKF